MKHTKREIITFGSGSRGIRMPAFSQHASKTERARVWRNIDTIDRSFAHAVPLVNSGEEFQMSRLMQPASQHRRQSGARTPSGHKTHEAHNGERTVLGVELLVVAAAGVDDQIASLERAALCSRSTHRRQWAGGRR